MSKRQLLLGTALLIAYEHALASTVVGRVGEIWASPTSYLVMFSIPGSNSKLHRCNSAERFSINLTLPGGRVTYELLQLAKQNEYVVSVETLNTCNTFDAENVKSLLVK